MRFDFCEVLQHSVERLNVAKLRIDIEQIPLGHARHAITHTFPNDVRPKSFSDRVLSTMAHASCHSNTSHNHGVHALGTKVARQIGTVVGASTFLYYNLLPALRHECNAVIDLGIGRPFMQRFRWNLETPQPSVGAWPRRILEPGRS